MPKLGRAARNDLPQRTLYTNNIDQHVSLIAKQTQKSLDDAQTRQLAVKIVSGKYVWRSPRRGADQVPMIEAWGEWFEVPRANLTPCPPREDLCEIELIWNFVVTNCRYVFDITNADTFATAEQTLKAGGGDCDDMQILFSALLMSVGFKMKARVISTPDAPNEWVHIYPLVGIFDKTNPTVWVPLDATVTGALPGWEYDNIAKQRDYNF